MFKKTILLSAFFLTFLSSAYALDTIPANGVDAECPVACPCCADAISPMLDGLDLINYEVNDFKKYLSETEEFKNTKKWTKQLDTSLPMTQSSNRTTQEKGWELYNEAAQNLKKIGDYVNEEKNAIDEQVELWEKDLKKIKELLNQLENCPCLESLDECCSSNGVPCSEMLKQLKDQIAQFERLLPELKRANASAALAALAVVSNYGPETVAISKKFDDTMLGIVKSLPKFDIKGLELIEDCCYKGKDECRADLIDGFHTPIDWLIDGGAVTTGLTGNDVATGQFGTLTITNHTGKPLNYTIPAGTVLYPGASDVQRMLITETVRGTIPAGGSVQVPLDGVCIDQGLHPPTSSKDSDVFFANPFAGLAEVLEGIYDIKVPGIQGFSLSSPNSSDLSRNPFDFGFNGGYQAPTSMDYLEELFSSITFKNVMQELIDQNKITSTGLPTEMEFNTILQWSIWNIFSGFGPADGENKINEQVQESGGSQTAAQIGQLNQGLWSNVDLVKKEAKKQISITPQNGANSNQRSDASDKKQRLSKSFFKSIQEMFSLESLAHAAESASVGLQGRTARALKEASFIKATFFNLIYDFEALGKSDYIIKATKVNQKNIDKTRMALTKALSDIRKSRPKIQEGQDFDAETLRKIRKYNVSLLEEDGSWDKLWDVYTKNLDSMYEDMDIVYLKLLVKTYQSKKEDKDYLDGLTQEEEVFFKIFTRVKLNYKILQQQFALETVRNR